MKLRWLASYGPAFVLALALLALWEVAARADLSLGMSLPAPSVVIRAFSLNWDAIYTNTLPTLLETVVGLFISIALGLSLAILLDLSSWLRRAVYPLLIVSQTVPIVALAPLMLIWFGFTLTPKIVVVILYCFFPIAVATADGLSSAEPDLIKLVKSMGASRWQILWLIRLPGALPAFFSGLRIAVTYSVTGAIVGEFIGAYQGLGIYMVTSTNSHALPVVFATIVMVALLSLALFSLVNIMERLTLPWYHAPRSPLFAGERR